MIPKLLLNTRLTFMDDIYNTIEKYNPNKECKIFIIFNDMLICLAIKNLSH